MNFIRVSPKKTSNRSSISILNTSLKRATRTNLLSGLLLAAATLIEFILILWISFQNLIAIITFNGSCRSRIISPT
jgi:hypothetical protein